MLLLFRTAVQSKETEDASEMARGIVPDPTYRWP